MPSLRDGITKTFTRLTRLGEPRSHDRAESDAPDTRIGRQFGYYRILRQLGAGGMGQIYLALDTRLGRHVALKFLPSDLVRDEVSLTRLVQEARAASALNHPNILTIYDVRELEGEHFIASEFVEGVTLRSAMARNLVSVQAAIDIASQIASALSAAHAAGVVHRDLKPSNVMLRPDGYVKVIDFGLAKRLARTAEAHRAVAPFEDETQLRQTDLTRTGTTIGTAEYMSPEQARGEEVDYRTDIWSLGVILYEMLCGHRPFEGATQSHVLVAIQDAPVPPLPADKSISPALHVIVARAIAKKPRDRYSSITDMLEALQAAASVTPTAHRIRIAPAPSRVASRTKTFLLAGVALLFVLAGIGFWWWNAHRPHWLHIEPVRQLTFNGRVQLDAISPDGKYLAYTVGQPDGQQALYLKQIASGSDELKIPPRRINYRGLTFAPDNQTLYVVEKDEALMGRLYAVPLLGPRENNPIVVDIDGPVSFAPDGNQFVYVQHQEVKGAHGSATRSLLLSASRDGQNKRALVSTTDMYIYRQPEWSPDGKRVAVFLLEANAGKPSRRLLDIVDLHGVESRRSLPEWEAIGQPQWTADSKSLVVGGLLTYSERNRRYQLHQLWLRTGADHALTNDLAAYSEVSLSADSKQMTATKLDSKAVIWVSRPNDFTHGDTAPAEAERDPALAWSDATHLIVNSRQNGFPNLALLDLQTKSIGLLTSDQWMEQGGVVIPGTGGKSVVFASNRLGQFHIWRFDADSNKFRQLTFGANYDEHPVVSPGGNWVVYTTWDQNVPHLRKVSVNGGAATQVSRYSAEDAQISPDGKWIACYLQNPVAGKWTVAIVPFEGDGQPRPVPEAGLPFRWSVDGSSIVSARTDGNGVSNLWSMPLNGGQPAQLTQFEERSMLAFAFSPAGDRVACLRATSGADVMLFKIAN